MQPLLKVEDLEVSLLSFSKKIRPLRGMTFHINVGEIVGLVGESGCGKSIAVRTLMGLLPKHYSRIEKGRILYRGENLLSKNSKELRNIYGKEMGMIFQDPMTSLNPTMRIGDQILEGYARHYPEIPLKERKNQAVDLLQKIGISNPLSRLKQYPHMLSGGMRQRVMLAIAIICSPALLIADEPTTALDVTIQAQILALLKEIQKSTQMSLLLITHDLSLVASFCDRVFVMYAGEIIESAPVDTLFKSPAHPYTQRLLDAIPRLDLPPEKTLIPIPGSPPDLSLKIEGCPFAKRCPFALPLCHSKKPSNDSVGADHSVSCWLLHPDFQKKGGDNWNPP